MNEWNKCEELVIRENTDYDKTIYIQRKEAIETVLNMLKEKDKEIENITTNYKNLIADVSGIAKELGLEEDGTIDEIYAEIKKKDKIIELMAEQLAGLTIWNNEKEEPLILGDKEEVKQYFERKSEE